MFVLVKSGWGGVLDGDASATGYGTYEQAFAAMELAVKEEAMSQGISDNSGDWGCDYDSGHGFAGAERGPEFQIFSL